MDSQPATTRTPRCRSSTWTPDLRNRILHELPHYQGNSRHGQIWTGSYSPHESGHYRLGDSSKQSRQPLRLDQESRPSQKGIAHASDAAKRRPDRCRGRIPFHSSITVGGRIMADQSIPYPGTLEPVAPEGRATLLETLHSWVITVDHKRLGILYVIYSIFFLLVGGIEAIFIRIQLAIPNNHFLDPAVFNRFFTMHGTTMVFLVGMPILFGFGNYLVPLMIGARDMAFPRLNAFSFWVSAFAGLLLYFSYVGGSGLYAAGSAPDVGWFAYAPLTAKVFSPGHSTDYWTLAVLLSGVGSIGTALNIVATILCLRCKGMTLSRMPLLPWIYLVMAGLVLVTI